MTRKFRKYGCRLNRYRKAYRILNIDTATGVMVFILEYVLFPSVPFLPAVSAFH
jgi:hypothetical protein